METFDNRLDSAGALADELRRQMYLFIRKQRRPVGRDEAADAVGISRQLAAFHLDKLVEKGLLSAGYTRLTGRSGPGAGRPAKVYEPSKHTISVSIPFRSYDVVGDILLDALESPRRSASPMEAVLDAAFERGVEVGKTIRPAGSRRLTSKKAQIGVVTEVLSEKGYEPYRDERGDLRVHNCPFLRLAQRSPDLVCGLNQAFVSGLLRGLGVKSLAASLDRRPGECCVQIHDEAVA